MFDADRTKLAVDGGAGGVWDKNPGVDVRSSGAITAGEKLIQTLTATTTLTQAVSALWKTNDWEDGSICLMFGVGVAASMSTRTQLKVELLDTYKNLPPPPSVRKNDLAVLMAVVYKM